MYTRQRREEGKRGRKEGTLKGDRAKRFRKRQTDKLWGHEWVERSWAGAVEEVMES